MNPPMRKRLDAIASRFGPDENKCGVVFFPLNGESDAEYDRRVERWYAVEKVEGQERLFTGNEILVSRIRFVSSERNEGPRAGHR